jgi:flagellar export protein FliJ
MSLDTRGFEYALEPVRQRSHHRVDTAVSKLGETQRDLTSAREQVDAAIGLCRHLAAQCTPTAKAAIDPHRAVTVARRMLMLHMAVTAAEELVVEKERAVADAQAELDKARIERETFETHRADLLAEHAVEQARRSQAMADQDWLARRTFTGEVQRGIDETR